MNSMHSIQSGEPARIPLSLITGFLGSGKTTLLRALLRGPNMADTAVIINEFGAIGLDHHLLEAVDGETVLIDGGCICCTVRDDLASTLAELHRKRTQGLIPRFRRVVIETTGLADPAPILHMLIKDAKVGQQYVLDSVITTVDAVHGDGQLNAQPESLKQAAVADRIVITKTDLASPAQVARLTARLLRINPGAASICAIEGAVDPDALFGAGLFDPVTGAANAQAWLQAQPQEDSGCTHQHAACTHAPAHHDGDIRSYSLTFDTPFDWSVVSNWLGGLAYFHGDKLLRMKGILNIEDEPGPIAVHAVQHLFHAPQDLPAWPDDDRRSRLVFITRGLSREVIVAALQREQDALYAI